MKKSSKFIFTALGALAALFAVVELVLHLVIPVEADLGTSLILNNQIQGVSSKVHFDVGRDLLRRSGWSDGAKASGTVRVLCIGGPATVGILQNVEDTWWGQIQNVLKAAHPNKRFEFGALGVESKGIRFGAKWAQTYFGEFTPDLVIVQHGIEDVLIHPESYQYDPDGLHRIQLHRERTGFKSLLVKSSQVVRRFTRSRQETGQKLRQKQIGQPNYFGMMLDVGRARYLELDQVFSIPRAKGSDPLDEYLEGLRTIVAASRESGSEVLLVGEPTLCGEFMELNARQLLTTPVGVNDPAKPFQKPEPGWVEKELYRYYAAANEFASEANVPFVNLLGAVPQDRAHFLNEALLTDEGARKVSQLLLPAVEKLLK
ncbi:MAG: SGNH/GDSL hydrolase family protein [Verrucomicrobia bacterium]|nr:SGNH/GDSL hydrolase family protein [Verrucomicrobiota bacterium]